MRGVSPLRLQTENQTNALSSFHMLTRQVDGFFQHVQVAHMVGQHQDESGIEQMAL